mmetsp:Transcript_3796/g.4593  ORF Transcript_3796/g.4593 Transcript_3796/m.4593 type:complete len:156 (-) Transcript_3796:1036-1503(-)
MVLFMKHDNGKQTMQMWRNNFYFIVQECYNSAMDLFLLRLSLKNYQAHLYKEPLNYTQVHMFSHIFPVACCNTAKFDILSQSFVYSGIKPNGPESDAILITEGCISKAAIGFGMFNGKNSFVFGAKFDCRPRILLVGIGSILWGLRVGVGNRCLL